MQPTKPYRVDAPQIPNNLIFNQPPSQYRNAADTRPHSLKFTSDLQCGEKLHLNVAPNFNAALLLHHCTLLSCKQSLTHLPI